MPMRAAVVALLLALAPATVGAFTAGELQLEPITVEPDMDLLYVAGGTQGFETLERDLASVRRQFDAADDDDIRTYAPGRISAYNQRAEDLSEARQFWYRFAINNPSSESAHLYLQLELRRQDQGEVFLLDANDEVVQHKLVEIVMPVTGLP